MKTPKLDFPKAIAYTVAQNLRKFRAATEEVASEEVNPNANIDRAAVVRVIDWTAYDKLIDQLELCFKGDMTRTEKATAKEVRQSFSNKGEHHTI